MTHTVKTTARHILPCMLLSLMATQAYAVAPYPGEINVTQADGSVLSVTRIGDGFYNSMLTEDGYPLMFNPSTGNHEYAVCRNGHLEGSGVAASTPEGRSKAEKAFVSTLNQQELTTALDREWRDSRVMISTAEPYSPSGAQRIVRISDVPTTGTLPVLVILVDFADKKFSDNAGTPDPAAYYDRFFHQEGFSDFGARGSAYDYYRDASCGKYDPQYYVYGPVQVSGSYRDYGGSSGTENVYRMIKEAVVLIDSKYDVDFSMFDTDGDGKVDNVYCLYAGYGRADSSDSETIWPHSSELSRHDTSFEVDGVTVERYTVSQQINGQTHNPVGIGTFVHEFGHVLGLADHYNNSSSIGNPPNNVGNWDLMSNGSYNGNQNCPPTYSAFERYSLGWAEPVELDLKSDSPVSIASYIETGQCYRVSVSRNDKEYFLIENRQQSGWDEFLPGHGLLVWHIEEDQLIWDQNRPNYDQNHQRVDIVEAGRLLTADGSPSDPFPGTKAVTSFQFQDWNGNQSFGFDWVEEATDGKCRFLLSDSGYELPAPKAEVKDLMGTSATLRWESSEFAQTYSVSVRCGDKEFYAEIFDEAGSTVLAGLEPETDYTALIMAKVNTLSSKNAEVRFTTLPLQLEEMKAEALDAADVTADGFMARWNEMAAADSYEIGLYTAIHDGEGVLTHGFDNFSTSNPRLPEGWKLTERQGRNENDFGQSAPSIRLRDEGANLTVCVPNETLEAVELWIYPNKAGLVLTAEECVDGQWREVWKHTSFDKRVVTPRIETEEADSIRFTLTREEGVTGGFILIDDVTLYYVYDRFEPMRTIEVTSDDIVRFQKVCGFRIEGLEPDTIYGYDVCGKNGSRHSAPSGIVKVVDKGITGIDNIGDDFNTVGSPCEIYNLQGMPVGRDLRHLPSGIYIVNGRKTAI